ncbi:MAG: SRPBCC family protein [Kiloniellales bacterium]
MVKTISIAGVALLVVFVAAVLVFAATKPDTFRVQRATSIAAPPEKIFALINDFDNWGSWSPYEKKDPAMKRALSGAEAGKGSVYEWEGDNNVGKGRMEITESSPPSKVALKLDFVKPFEAHNMVEFTLVPEGEATNVTWDMHGPAPFVSKVMQVFVDMDSMVGKDFEAGLANLKTLAEQ